MITEPPLSGAVQTMVTAVFEVTRVVGAAGVLGLAAALITTSDEKVLNPIRFLLWILNV